MSGRIPRRSVQVPGYHQMCVHQKSHNSTRVRSTKFREKVDNGRTEIRCAKMSVDSFLGGVRPSLTVGKS